MQKKAAGKPAAEFGEASQRRGGRRPKIETLEGRLRSRGRSYGEGVKRGLTGTRNLPANGVRSAPRSPGRSSAAVPEIGQEPASAARPAKGRRGRCAPAARDPSLPPGLREVRRRGCGCHRRVPGGLFSGGDRAPLRTGRADPFREYSPAPAPPRWSSGRISPPRCSMTPATAAIPAAPLDRQPPSARAFDPRRRVRTRGRPAATRSARRGAGSPSVPRGRRPRHGGSATTAIAPDVHRLPGARVGGRSRSKGRADAGRRPGGRHACRPLSRTPRFDAAGTLRDTPASEGEHATESGRSSHRRSVVDLSPLGSGCVSLPCGPPGPPSAGGAEAMMRAGDGRHHRASKAEARVSPLP